MRAADIRFVVDQLPRLNANAESIFRSRLESRAKNMSRADPRAGRKPGRSFIYGTVAGGSYHVTIRTPGVSHNSFTDIRHLGPPDGAGINGWAEDVRAATPHAHILGVIRAWTRAFFR